MAYFCEENPNYPIVQYNETRFTDSANDKDCHVVYDESKFEGSWGNKQLGVDKMSVCQDGNNAYASILTDQERFVYVIANSYENGRILTGQYYAEAQTGNQRSGPFMFFPVSKSEAVQVFWTGDSINPAQLNDPSLHRVETGIQYRDSSSSGCHDYSFVVEDFGSGSIVVPVLALVFSLMFALL